MIHDWKKYEPYFTKAEFDCKETGRNQMQPEFMDKLLLLRQHVNFPFIITSGYRDITHSVERNKDKPGYHTKGIAVDIAVQADRAWTLVSAAMLMGFYGVGVSQRKGIPRFIHLDTRPDNLRVLYGY